MEGSRILLGLLCNLLVAALVKSECITYDKGNGEFETTCNPPEPISPSKMVTDDSTPSCFKVNLIVFYDNHFRDSSAAPLDPAVRVQQVLDLAQSTNTFGFSPYFSGLGIDIQLNTVAIDHYNGTYVPNDNSMLRTTVANPDTRVANIWIFLTAALGAGTVGQSSNNDPCGSTKQVGTFKAYTNDDADLAGLLATHIGLLLAQLYPFSDYYNENQPFCLETCCDNCNKCKDAHRNCSSIVDINGNPYQCLPEKEAANWPKQCLPDSHQFCRYDGPSADDCEWTDWLDQDNPSGHGDYEPAPDGCNIQKYQVQMVSEGTIYDDVADMDQCLIDSPYVACINKHQSPTYNCDKGTVNPTISPIDPIDPIDPTVLPPMSERQIAPVPIPVLHDQCRDYRVKYCCGKPKPKCYCCPPRLPVNNCTDTGCNYEFSQLGECVDITNPNWKALNNMYDLSQTANIYGIPWQTRQTQLPGLCGASLDDSCCRCMKKKTCKDTGCEKRFGGNGVCIDAVDGDLSKYDLDFDVNPDQTPGLCTNDVNDNCCSCFKKQDSDSGCYKVRCYVGKVEGICVGSNDPYPLEYIKTDQRCEEKGDCQCFIPCRDIWKPKKCRKYAGKGKCEEATTAAKCCATCKNY